MKIAYIAAGAAGMYCGTCISDNTLAAEMQRRGVDFILIPTYTPIRTDERDVSLNQVFYGGINVYLQQKLAFFRHTPRVFDRLLDGRGLLKSLSRFSGSTSAEDLGGLTISVLQGELGPHKKELDRLVRWLRETYKPDLVHLTNSMFLGFARELRRELNVPVICALQGEDIFLEDLIDPYKSQAISLLRERAADVDGFTAPCEYYADFMSEYLSIDRDRIRVVKLGVSLDGFGDASSLEQATPFTIGYLARICPEKGLHLLAQAFRELTAAVGKDKVRLKVAGYLGQRDASYFEEIKARMARWELTDSVDYVGEVDRKQKLSFLNSIHVLSVPTPYHEPKGRFVLEALANGVPVVQPRHGNFPELLEDTGGGILVEPGNTFALAGAFQHLMEHPEQRMELGRRGREKVYASYSAGAMADAMLEVYRSYIDAGQIAS
jgi:glycosyltransferase involved in cell wall biosynthesis